MFYGIIIYLYFLDKKRHHLPHIHAKYQEQEAVYSVEDGTRLEGDIPQNKEKLVQAGKGKPRRGHFTAEVAGAFIQISVGTADRGTHRNSAPLARVQYSTHDGSIFVW